MYIGRNSVAVIATRYGLDGPVIESLWWGGGDIRNPFRPKLGPIQPLVQWIPGQPWG